MAQFKNINHKVGTNVGTGQVITFGGGINTFQSPYVGEEGSISKNQSPQIDNSIVLQNPILEPRKGIQAWFTDSGIMPLTDVNGCHGISSRFNLPIIHYTTIVYLWNGAIYDSITATTGAVTAQKSNIISFKRLGVTYTIFSNIDQARYYIGTGTFGAITGMPLTNKTCIDDRRVFGLLNGILYYSAANNPIDWTTPLDAGSIEISGFNGYDIACVAYQNTVISFSTKSMHILYGDEVDDYNLSDPINVGAMSFLSIIEHRGKLYFIGYDKKIYVYVGGGIPEIISNPVSYWLDLVDVAYGNDTASAASYDRWLLFSIPVTGSQNTTTLVYDVDLQIWQKWDIGFQYFVTINNRLYGFIRGKQLYRIFGTGYTDENTSTVVSWNYYTGYWTEGTIIGNKTLTAIHVHYYKPAGSQMSVAYESDASGSFTTIEVLASNTVPTVYRVEILPSIIYDVKYFRLKFVCQGEGKIYGIEPEYRIKDR